MPSHSEKLSGLLFFFTYQMVACEMTEMIVTSTVNSTATDCISKA